MIGQTIAQYQILAKLGEGGMGVVYKVRDTRLGRLAALKVLAQELLGNREGKRRFVQEAQAASALNHPNIVTIYEIDHAEEIDFIAMEFIEGRTLAELIPAGGLSWEQALPYARQVVGALAKAHGAGIIHRDLKPRNIMVTPDGIVKILDFGVAKLLGGTRSGESNFQATDAGPEEATAHASVYGESSTRAGAVLGTVAYMAPEQAEGKPVDPRADIFSFGVVLYEMLSGTQPFRRDSTLGTLAAVLRDEPVSLGSLRKDLPPSLDAVVRKALAKRPKDRYASAVELAQHLGAVQNVPEGSALGGRRGSQGRHPALLGGATILVLLGLLAGGWAWRRHHQVRWAQTAGLSEIARLSTEGKGIAAFDLAKTVGQLIPNDPRWLHLWAEVAETPLIETEPSGAEVHLREMDSKAATWRYVGKTPITKVPVPHGYFRWKAVKPGYADAAGSAPTWWAKILFRLAPEDQIPEGMVLVPGADSLGANIGNIASMDSAHESFFIDRFEVTNQAFKRFVDAGGYEKHEFWKEPFQKEGTQLSWEEAMREFHDASGRPGPSTWEGGTFPQGQEDFPVTGVSWYEAAAYAEFAGKSLPTVSHWCQAADVRVAPFLIPLSNFGGKGPARVGSYSGIGPFGTSDMAGNAQEWCWNEADSHYRFILGGAWNSPTYQFTHADAKPPFDRHSPNGFRCARYTKAIPESLLEPKVRNVADYSKSKPADEETFRVIRDAYAFDPKPLNPSVHAVDDSSPYWRKETISFDAAYANDRVPAFLFLPKNAKPPYQTLVYHPGAGAVSGTLASLDGFSRVDFIIRSGRAVIYPIYAGTFNRALPPTKSALEGKQRLIMRFKDLERSIEYLCSRSEIDPQRLGYIGVSWGAAFAPVMLSLEPRLKVAVLCEGGLYTYRSPLAEADPFQFLPHVRAPVLMLNGKFDYTFPVTPSQETFFKWLGTPDPDKRRIIYDSAHDVMIFRSDVVREVLAWLDTHLGPVSPRS